MQIIGHLDHLVLTVTDIDRSCEFYQDVLGMEVIHFGDNRTALKYGQQKINLHPKIQPIAPCAKHPTVGSADLCFIVVRPLQQISEHLATLGVAIELGPVPRTGASGPIRSLYIRDPDGNLLELAETQQENI